MILGLKDIVNATDKSSRPGRTGSFLDPEQENT